MSKEYDKYLAEHKENVRQGYYWLKHNIPEIFEDGNIYEYGICEFHDKSKSDIEEYNAYDQYFYGGIKTKEVIQNFNKAWLKHIHLNPHHWQHWVLINDDSETGEIILDMPYGYIIEMICDWWSFSWKNGELFEIFNWYEKHKDYIKLSDRTRKIVEDILLKMKTKLGGVINE